jgi:hypothetical protein
MTETHSQKQLIGYARVSTFGQTLDSQLEQLREAGCSRRNIYKEKVTGARPGPGFVVVNMPLSLTQRGCCRSAPEHS